jgi:hypothetical protein
MTTPLRSSESGMALSTIVRCAYRACGAPAEHRLCIVPEGESGRTGRVLVCTEHVTVICRDARRIMAACLAYLEERPARRYRVIAESPGGRR